MILRGDLCWVKTPDLVTRQILDRGYILAEFNRCEFAPDRTPDAVGLFAAYPDHEFGAVAAWAWGYHRAIDFLLTQPEVDAEKIAITGHSRGGKAVLLAGATDDRIALTAPNNSGTGGAAPYRFQSDEGEPLRDITKNFPTWLTPRLKEYAGREDELPFDQHSLKAVIAPRVADHRSPGRPSRQPERHLADAPRRPRGLPLPRRGGEDRHPLPRRRPRTQRRGFLHAARFRGHGFLRQAAGDEARVEPEPVPGSSARIFVEGADDTAGKVNAKHESTRIFTNAHE